MTGFRSVTWTAAVLALLFAGQAAAQAPATRPAPSFAWAPKPEKTPYAGPNKPHWKLADLLKAHARQADWSQTMVRDPGGLTARYIQLAPGGKTKTSFYADSSLFWIVAAGQMRVLIEGQEPFLAGKGFIVQVPARIPFHVETVGDAPSLRLEVTHTRSTPFYPIAEVPDPVKHMRYLRVAFGGGPGGYGTAKPYLDFQKDVVEGGARPGGFVHDGETAANVVRGPGVARPPDSDPGHFHDGTSEFWFVMEGEVDFLIEGVPYFTTGFGDIVYAPAGRWHRASLGGAGMSTRISIHPVGTALNSLDPERSGAAP
jgi:mannose-6-phosphate isomerase-like protein (cupin superfamily)